MFLLTGILVLITPPQRAFNSFAFAAWVVRILPMRVLGTAVGGIILVTNMKTFLNAVGVSGGLALVVYALIVVVWVAALAHSIMVNRQERKASAEAKVLPT